MEANRKTAVLVGVLFIIGTVSGILAGVASAPIREGATYPLNISSSETRWMIGTLLILLMEVVLVMIPVLLYPVFKKHNEVLALGAVLFRGVLEIVIGTGLVFVWLLLLTMSDIDGKSGAIDASSFQTLGAMLSAAGEWFQMVSALVFCIGSVMISTLFYQTRLVPRWLSGWGLIGAGLYFIANLASLFGSQHLAPSLDAGIGQLMIPLAIQEMVFAVWMIAKGFNSQTMAAPSVKTNLRIPVQS